MKKNFKIFIIAFLLGIITMVPFVQYQYRKRVIANYYLSNLMEWMKENKIDIKNIEMPKEFNKDLKIK